MKLTRSTLRQLVIEELSKFGDMVDVEDVANDTDEVDAGDLADTVENQRDHHKDALADLTETRRRVAALKALRAEEARISRRLGAIKEQRVRLSRSITKK